MASYTPVIAATRVLDVLVAVNSLRDNATVGAVPQYTKINKPTIVRMLETLIQAGYVTRSLDDNTYHVTGRTLMLSSAFDRHKLIGAVVGPLLNEFRQVIDWPSDVAIMDQASMLVIETSRQCGPMSFHRTPGYRAPVLGTSLGRAYLAHSTDDELSSILEIVRSDPAPWNDIAHDRHALDDALANIRKEGHATMDPRYSRAQYSDRVSSIGVAIRTSGTVFASINVIYLRNTLSASAARDTLVGPLRQAADRMAQELSVRMPDAVEAS